MKSKIKYETLDEIGFIGIQNDKTISSLRYHAHKTAEIFRQARSNKSKPILSVHKKAS